MSSIASSPPVSEDIFEEVKVWARSESVSLMEEKEEREARSGVSGRTGESRAMVLYSKAGTFKPCAAEWSGRVGTAICRLGLGLDRDDLAVEGALQDRARQIVALAQSGVSLDEPDKRSQEGNTNAVR